MPVSTVSHHPPPIVRHPTQNPLSSDTRKHPPFARNSRSRFRRTSATLPPPPHPPPTTQHLRCPMEHRLRPADPRPLRYLPQGRIPELFQRRRLFEPG